MKTLFKVECFSACGGTNLHQTGNDEAYGCLIGWCKDCHHEWVLG